MASRSARPKLLAIVGPTASGKSELAMRLAKKFNGEIIAADSRTVYRGMDIGTAKPSEKERAAVQHHLIDLVEPDQKFNVGQFKILADKAIADIQKRHKLPILVGGSGLYVDSVLFGYQFDPTVESDPQNPRHRLGASKPNFSKINPGTLIIGLSVDADKLKSQITQRVNKMVRAGLVDEVKELAKKYKNDAEVFKTPGYRPFFEYMAGKINLPAAIDDFIQGDLRLAKKQRTWFKRDPNIIWFDDMDSAYEYVKQVLNK